MAQPLSMDRRSQLLAAVEGGMSCRAAAARFGVAPSAAIRWQALRRTTIEVAPKPQGGDMSSRWVEQRVDGRAVRHPRATGTHTVRRRSGVYRQCRAGMADEGRGKDTLYHARQPLGERVLRELQWLDAR